MTQKLRAPNASAGEHPKRGKDRRPITWLLVVPLALLLLLPVAVITTTLVDTHSALNTVIGGRRIYMGRVRGVIPAQMGVASYPVPAGRTWLFTSGFRESYLVYIGTGTATLLVDDTIRLDPPVQTRSGSRQPN